MPNVWSQDVLSQLGDEEATQRVRARDLAAEQRLACCCDRSQLEHMVTPRRIGEAAAWAAAPPTPTDGGTSGAFSR